MKFVLLGRNIKMRKCVTAAFLALLLCICCVGCKNVLAPSSVPVSSETLSGENASPVLTFLQADAELYLAVNSSENLLRLDGTATGTSGKAAGEITPNIQKLDFLDVKNRLVFSASNLQFVFSDTEEAGKRSFSLDIPLSSTDCQKADGTTLCTVSDGDTRYAIGSYLLHAVSVAPASTLSITQTPLELHTPDGTNDLQTVSYIVATTAAAQSDNLDFHVTLTKNEPLRIEKTTWKYSEQDTQELKDAYQTSDPAKAKKIKAYDISVTYRLTKPSNLLVSPRISVVLNQKTVYCLPSVPLSLIVG